MKNEEYYSREDCIKVWSFLSEGAKEGMENALESAYKNKLEIVDLMSFLVEKNNGSVSSEDLITLAKFSDEYVKYYSEMIEIGAY